MDTLLPIAYVCSPVSLVNLEADDAAARVGGSLAAVGVDYGALLAEPRPQLQGNPQKPKLIYGTWAL